MLLKLIDIHMIELAAAHHAVLTALTFLYLEAARSFRSIAPSDGLFELLPLLVVSFLLQALTYLQIPSLPRISVTLASHLNRESVDILKEHLLLDLLFLLLDALDLL